MSAGGADGRAGKPDAGAVAVAVVESVDELRGRLGETPLGAP